MITDCCIFGTSLSLPIFNFRFLYSLFGYPADVQVDVHDQLLPSGISRASLLDIRFTTTEAILPRKRRILPLPIA